MVAEAVMKKVYSLAILFLAIFLFSCDPKYDITLANNTGIDIEAAIDQSNSEPSSYTSIGKGGSAVFTGLDGADYVVHAKRKNQMEHFYKNWDVTKSETLTLTWENNAFVINYTVYIAK